MNPWSPFDTKSEFQFAKIVLKAPLKQAHIETSCEIIECACSGQDGFGIKSAADLELHLNNINNLLPSVS
jgi:hypothetical protein